MQPVIAVLFKRARAHSLIPLAFLPPVASTAHGGGAHHSELGVLYWRMTGPVGGCWAGRRAYTIAATVVGSEGEERGGGCVRCTGRGATGSAVGARRATHQYVLDRETRHCLVSGRVGVRVEVSVWSV